VDYLFLALLLIIFSSSHVSFSEQMGIGSRQTELFLPTKGFDFMPGRKQYKLETYLQADRNATFATSSTVFFNTDQCGHLHPPVSLLGLMDKSAPWSVPLPTQDSINPGHACPPPGVFPGPG